jgi:hypothetical protein
MNGLVSFYICSRQGLVSGNFIPCMSIVKVCAFDWVCSWCQRIGPLQNLIHSLRVLRATVSLVYCQGLSFVGECMQRRQTCWA